MIDITLEMFVWIGATYWFVASSIADAYGWWTYPITVIVTLVIGWLSIWAGLLQYLCKALPWLGTVWLFLVLVDCSNASAKKKDHQVPPKAIIVEE